MLSIKRITIALLLIILSGQHAYSGNFVALTAPLPPYSINKGLRVQGVAVDTLVMIMALSGSPIDAKDVKLMLWRHALQIGAAGPQKIVMNLPRTPDIDDKFKWVGPLTISKHVVIGHKGGKKLASLKELENRKVGTLRNSMAEKALLKSGVPKSVLSSSVSHIIPLKKLDTKMIDYFAHGNASTAYLMETLCIEPNRFEVVHTFEEVPLYFAFSKDTSDEFIKKLNDNLRKLKKPGADGKSRFDKIVTKYLPPGTMN